MGALPSKMLAFYLVVFWLLCAAGAALMIRSQALAPAGGDLGNAALAALIGVGAVGLGAAMTSLILTLAVEAIMVLAQMLKQRQYEQGYEEGVEDGVEIGVERGVEIGREEGVELGVERGRKEGVEIGREETRQQYEHARRMRSAKLRAWAEERGIPADELPELDEPPER